MKPLLAFLLCILSLSAWADEPAPAPVPPPAWKPGDVLRVKPDAGLEAIDMNKFFVLGIEWQGPTPAGIEYGLRSDNVVVWRKVAK